MLSVSEVQKFIDNDIVSEKKKFAGVGQRYYEGEHDIRKYRLFYYNADGKLIEDKVRSNVKISHPFFTELSDQLSAYMLSFDENPMVAKDTAEGLQEHLDNYFDDEFWSEIGDVITGSYTKGFEYLFAYKNADDRLTFMCADSMGVVECREKDTSDHKRYIIYHYVDRIEQGKKVIRKIQVWSETETFYYIQDGLNGKIVQDESEPVNPRPHIVFTDQKTGKKMGCSLGYIPFWRLDYNKKQFSGLKPIKGLIDDYDIMQCGLSNNLKAFTGNMYVLHGEGIPLIVPIDQEKVVRAVQVNSKISKGLYSRLGEDVDLLKRKITAQISRGVATGMSYSQMAQQLAGYTKIGYNNAVRITRTEGHRIQQESTMDACYAARERGADVVKQWDATMDANTRESHQMVDGEIRALDEKFSNGLMYPGDPSGNAAEVINCRCILLQRAKWALDQKELDRLKERASFYGLDKTKSFDEFNKKYIGTVENSKGNKIKMDLQFFAKIPDEKLTEYALNFEHPTGKEKAKAFKEALGYTKESYTDLKTKILDSFDEKELVYKREDKYGKRYEQIMQITGPNGKTANVLTAWIKDNDNAEPRLTSIYVDKR